MSECISHIAKPLCLKSVNGIRRIRRLQEFSEKQASEARSQGTSILDPFEGFTWNV